jgi:hypothetical protein
LGVFGSDALYYSSDFSRAIRQVHIENSEAKSG